MVNIIDTNSVKVNDDLMYLPINIGPDKNHPVIVVDDFLADIDGFIDNIINKVPLEADRENFDNNSNIPGFTSPISLLIPEVRRSVAFFIDKFTDFEITNPDKLRFAFQLNCLYSHSPIHHHK